MAFNFNVQEAVREKIAVKIALMGPSGCGKSYSALRLATGMIDEMRKRDVLEGTNGKILFANTEGPRGRYYAKEFKFDIVDLNPPYNPELFIDLINFAVQQKYSILVIDSSSAEWEGRGGCLDLQQQFGGNYQAWAKVTPRHDKFIDTMAYSPIHIISTMRGKDQYELDKDDRGKVTVKKLGVGAKQRDGFEYYFTTTFLIDRDSHMAKCEKDNTHIFENEGTTILDESHGSKIIDWANDGADDNSYAGNYNPVKAEVPAGNPAANGKASDSEVASDIESIASLIEALKTKGVDRMDIAKAISKHHIVNGKPVANYNTITDGNVAKAVLAELESLA